MAHICAIMKLAQICAVISLRENGTMAVYIDQILDYLDANPICYDADGVESLLQMLYTVYSRHNTVDSDQLRVLRDRVAAAFDLLPARDRELALSRIGDWCKEHEQLAFIHGFIVGIHLMTEIRTVR